MSRAFAAASSQFLRAFAPLISAGAPFSIAGWIRTPTAAPTADQFIWQQSNSSASYAWRLLVEGSTPGDRGKIRWVARENSSNGRAQTAGVVSANTWHHVAATELTAANRAVYLDGTDKGVNTGNKNPLSTSHDRTVIGSNRGDVEFWDGELGHFAMWSVALSDAEVLSLSEGAHPLKLRRGDLLAYWPLNGQAPELDIVGGLDLPLVNAPTIGEEPDGLFGDVVVCLG